MYLNHITITHVQVDFGDNTTCTLFGLAKFKAFTDEFLQNKNPLWAQRTSMNVA